MMTPQYETGLFTMGLGFFLEKIGDHLVAEHSGGWPGFISSMRVVPDQKLAMIAFTNNSSGAPDFITKEVLHRMLGLDAPSEKPKTQILQHPEIWSDMVGSYGPKPGYLTNFRFWSSMRGEAEVYVKNGQLKLRGFMSPDKNGIELKHCDAAQPYALKGYVGLFPVPVLFQCDSHGKVVSLAMGSNVLYKRPYQQSMQAKLIKVLGAAAGAVLAVIFSKRMMKRK
jgi:hypothetical protein